MGCYTLEIRGYNRKCGKIFEYSLAIWRQACRSRLTSGGRIYLPKEIRERFGDRYRIVELPNHVALFPVDEDPLEGLRAAVGDAFEGDDVAELKEGAREAIAREVQAEAEQRAADHEE